MASTPAEKKSQLLDKVVNTLIERLPEQTAPMVEVFARQYYAGVAPEDVLDKDPEDLYGAVLSYWNFLLHRKPKTPSIRVYNPNLDENGWQSTHTIVDIATDDMPFLVDSVIMALNRHGLTVHLIIHPVIRVQRSEEGRLAAILAHEDSQGMAEATMHCEVDHQTDPALLQSIKDELIRVLRDIRVAVEDWRAMHQRLTEITDKLDTIELPQLQEDVEEDKAFLRWIAKNNFTFLGYREYDLTEINGQVELITVGHSGLGILREEGTPHSSPSFKELPLELRKLSLEPTLLVISKAKARSTVHRPVHLDYLGIKRYDANGKVTGEHRFLGLYTAMAYSMNPRSIPLLRNKITQVLQRSKLPMEGHAGKALQNILDTFPRDDLFQTTPDALLETAMGILHLQERQRLRLFVRKDIFHRFVSCLVYVPRERYNTALRLRMEDILMQAFNGTEATFNTQFSESILARVQFHIRTTPGQIPDYSVHELEEQMREAMLSWQDELHRSLLEQCGEEQGNELFRRYGDAFPAAYRDDVKSRTAVRDILRLETLSSRQPLAMHLYRPLEDTEGVLNFKLYGPERPMPLSQVLPMLEKLGLKVLAAWPYELCTQDGVKLWMIDFDMKQEQGMAVDVAEVKDIFQDAFARVWNNQMENDGFNRLVLGARIAWRDVVMLRAYCKYLLQIRVAFSQPYMQRTLIKHPDIAQLLAKLFHTRFDPALEDNREDNTAGLVNAINAALEQVSSLDEDRILRHFLTVLQATLRTNFFQADEQGQIKEYISFKFDPSKIPEMPLPRPMFEIFVYSPRVEAVHLRGGPVARGGLRWSDRLEDFRTEVLGLVKAQMVKNAVIVPVGSKGGFVVKHPPSASREALQQEVLFCYKTFMRGMLDITDNRVEDKIVPPRQVVRYDSDDPYLVVAADKGTATFSDVANGIALEYGFWLGDAFASGGSVGYDHKKMGITARGAWESVKRHFRELGMDIQNRDDFTVVGIGDMAGDVFGNGMLLSRHIKLLAAFNHLHIFLDPNPDPETSYQERERLFKLPRSSWEDYDASLISAGGGIHSRSAKSIPITPQVREALGINAAQLPPTELINRLLKAPVDLLWNGGIGTYVKAASETHADAGDKANDVLRINGNELNCKVVGEGGNLGLTQLARIEFARKGGKVLTDAIDNSAGVNCSDHEVNIKILLSQAVNNGDMTEKQRNRLLVEMTDEVAELVLRQNYLQPQAISITSSRAPKMLSDHSRVIRFLERSGRLNRTLEFLPDDEEIAERAADGQGLTPPELSVLLAYNKIILFEELVQSDVPEDPYLRRELLVYFPKPLRETYLKEMDNHPLRREIIATYITNSTLNRMGSVFAIRLQEDTGESAPTIARAYTAARVIFDARQLWSKIDALDNKVAAEVQINMHLESRQLLEWASLWLLRHRRSPLDIQTVVSQFADGIAALKAGLPGLLQAKEAQEFQENCQRLIAAGVPEDVAHWVVSLEVIISGLDLIEVAGQAHIPVEHAASMYFSLAGQLQLNWLRESIMALPATNHWQDLARAALLDGLYDQARTLTADVLQQTAPEKTPEDRLQAWLEHNRSGVERCLHMFADLQSSGQPDMAMLSVALRETGNLTHGGAG